ncbi:MAG: hypothetical protein DMF76_25675 [Acidobacteria bacterium]|nr:MAG: hypothetical protein DMF76_25675 [Acidobacteriota bacterium]
MRFTFPATIFVAFFLGLSIIVSAQTESRDQVLNQIEAKRAELAALEKSFLEPSADDYAAYAEFLKQPDTGLTRLLPRETYDDDVKSNKKSLTTRGGGAYYSFTRRTHEYGWGTQIGLEQNEFNVSFAGADYGMITNLGDVPLEAVTSENPAIKFLASYSAAEEEPQARSEYRRFASGETIGGTIYKTRAQARLNRTYALRGIHYSDSDVLVAFRIIRKDDDDSVIILWKLLKKYPKPELARNN